MPEGAEGLEAMRRKPVECRGYLGSPFSLRMREGDLHRVREAFDTLEYEAVSGTIPLRLHSQMGLLISAREEGRGAPRFESELAGVRSGVVVLEDGSAWAKTPYSQGWVAAASPEFIWDKTVGAIRKCDDGED